MSLFSELDEKDKNGLFKSNDNIVCYPTGFAVLDYANGYWTEVMDKDGNMVHVPNIGIPGGSMVSIIGSTGNGKAIPESTMLPTPTGMKAARDIKPGDFLFDRMGNRTKVLGVFPQGEKEVYEVCFQDGRTALCCDDHLWTVISGYDADIKVQTLPLKEIYRDYAQKACVHSDGEIGTVYKYGVPMSGPCKFDHIELEISPRIAGIILGYIALDIDRSVGYFDNAVRIDTRVSSLLSTPDFSEIPLSEVSESWISGIYNKQKDRPLLYSDLFATEEEFSKFIEFFTIPDRYLYNSMNNRKEFLMGILDVTYARQTYTEHILDSLKVIGTSVRYVANIAENMPMIYEDAREEFIRGIQFIARSLGMYASYEGGILTIDNPPCCKKVGDKKKATFSYEYGRLMITYIQRKSYREPMVCLYVDNKEHLFQTENFVVTHNTTLATQIGWNIVKNFEDGMMFVIDCEKSSERERMTNILGCDRDEPRIRITKAKSSIDDVLESFDLLCKTKEAGGRKYMYEVKNRTFNGQSFWTYVPSVYIIDSLPKFNCRDFNDKDLGGNIDAMRGAKDVTRFYTNVVDRAWQFNVIFIAINHIRPNSIMNPYAQPPRGLMMINPQVETLPRGSVAQYYSSIYFRINSKKSAAYTIEDDGFTGFKCDVQLAKSRTNIIGSTFPLTFNSDRGFDPIYSMYEFASALGLIQGRNPYLSVKGFEERKFNRKEFITLMTVDEQFRSGILNVLRPYYESLLSSRQERVAEIRDIPDLSMTKEE